MKIALAQMNMGEDTAENLKRAVDFTERVAKQGAELILFPELTLTPFFPNKSGIDAAKYLMSADGAEVNALREVCRRNHIAASPNVYLEENGKRYDASLMIDSGGEIAGVSKMVHIASFPDFYEAEYYTPSDGSFEVYELDVSGGICRVGIVICFDRHFPESIRCCALKGADIVLIPTANMIGEPDELFLWELRVQAMQNSVFIAMCNRVGEYNGSVFSGLSAVVGCGGEVIYYADGEEELITADIDVFSATEKRRAMPYFAARRPEKYGSISEKV